MRVLNRKNFITLLALILTGLFVAPAAHALNWKYNLDSALREAEQSGKWIMVDFYTDWCGWCKRLDADTYSDREIQELLKEFVCVKINADRQKAIAQKYGVNSFPQIFFLTPSGQETLKVRGYVPPDKLKPTLESIIKQQKAIDRGVKLNQASGSLKAAPVEMIKVKRSSEYELSGIMYDDANPTAVVNDIPVVKGDRVHEAVVIEITEKTVTLDHNGEKIVLEMD